MNNIFIKHKGVETEYQLSTQWSELDAVDAQYLMELHCKGLTKAKLQAEVLSMLIPVPSKVLKELPNDHISTLIVLIKELLLPPNGPIPSITDVHIAGVSYFAPMQMCANFTNAQMATVDTFMREEPIDVNKCCAAIVQAKQGTWDSYEAMARIAIFQKEMKPWQAYYLMSVTVAGYAAIAKQYPSRGKDGKGWLHFIYSLAENGAFGNVHQVESANALTTIAYGNYLEEKNLSQSPVHLIK